MDAILASDPGFVVRPLVAEVRPPFPETFLKRTMRPFARVFPRSLLWALLASLAISISAAPRQIAPRVTSETVSGYFVVSGDVALFVDGDGIWRTDGTLAGTRFVAPRGDAAGLTDVNGVVFYKGSDSFNGEQLWRTEGTAETTRLVRVVVKDGGQHPTALTNVEGMLYFVASDGNGAMAVWKSDGTESGTVMVKGGFGTNLTASGFAAVNGRVLFSASLDGQGVDFLWSTDGTEAGTQPLATAATSARGFTKANGLLCFSANFNLWRSDGSAAGTYPLRPSSLSAYFLPGHSASGESYVAFEGIEEGVAGLFRSDGTDLGTYRLSGSSGDRPPANLTAMGGRVYYAGFTVEHGVELWRTDGTVAGTAMVKDAAPGAASSNPAKLSVANGTLFYMADDGSHGSEMWTSDGTALRTHLASDLTPGPASSSVPWIASSGRGVFFSRVAGSGPSLWFEALPAPSQDFDGDGSSDFAFWHLYAGDVYVASSGGRAGPLLGRTVYTERDTRWTVIGNADFNADGVSDLLWRNGDSGELYLQVFDRDGQVADGASIYREPIPDWRVEAIGDLDGDGAADLVWRNSSTGAVYLMLLDGFSIKRQGMAYQEPDLNWRIVGTGDFEGSRRSEYLLWQNISTGVVWQLKVDTGSAVFTASGAPIYREPNLDWRIIAVGDLDGDGKADLLWRNGSTGAIWGQLMDGQVIVSQRRVYLEPNLAWEPVAFGDYDGDGRHDILWLNSTSGAYHVTFLQGLDVSAQRSIYDAVYPSWKSIDTVIR